MSKANFTLVADTGSQLAVNAMPVPGAEHPSGVRMVETDAGISDNQGVSVASAPTAVSPAGSALRTAIAQLPWAPTAQLDDQEKLFAFFLWICNQEALDFAIKPRDQRLYAEITIPADLNVSQTLLSQVVLLLQQSSYDADAPVPKFGSPQKILVRSKTVRQS